MFCNASLKLSKSINSSSLFKFLLSNNFPEFFVFSISTSEFALILLISFLHFFKQILYLSFILGNLAKSLSDLIIM
jgi:hypothetical protein